MAFTHAFTYGLRSGSGDSVGATFERTGGAEINISETIAASQTDERVEWVCDVSAVASFLMVADVACIVKAYDGSNVLKATFNLVANEPVMGFSQAGISALFDDTDVAYLKVTTTDEALLSIRSLSDPTP